MVLPNLICHGIMYIQKQKFTLHLFCPSVKPQQCARSCEIEVSMIRLSSSKIRPNLSNRTHLIQRISIVVSSVYFDQLYLCIQDMGTHRAMLKALIQAFFIIRGSYYFKKLSLSCDQLLFTALIWGNCKSTIPPTPCTAWAVQSDSFPLIFGLSVQL